MAKMPNPTYTHFLSRNPFVKCVKKKDETNCYAPGAAVLAIASATSSILLASTLVVVRKKPPRLYTSTKPKNKTQLTSSPTKRAILLKTFLCSSIIH
jgi:hypothetical protein